MTIRARVTALATFVVVLVLVASGAVLVGLQRQTLTASLDESLQRMAAGLIADMHSDPTDTTLRPHGDEDTVAQVVARDGTVLAATSNLHGRARISRTVAPRTGVHVAQVASVVGERTPDRLLTRRIRVPGGVATLYVGAPLDDLHDNIRFLTRTMIGGIPIVAAMLAALVWWLVGRTLRPVEHIRAQVAAIRGTDTHMRVPEPTGDDEIARLAKTMNAMLERIDETTQRQQRFVADASHELRTPLTRMRAELEVDLAHPEVADPQATQASTLEELTTLQELVEDLLHLARSDAGATAPYRDAVDLAAIVRDEANQSSAAGVVVDATHVASAHACGSADELRRVVRNLMANAVRHAHSRVTVELRGEDAGALLAIADDGDGVAPQDRERIFERFARSDDSRTAATGGAGLGLAIARDIVERHGGTISVVPSDAPGARFEVRLPPATD